MKKVIALCLALLMLAAMFSGCASSGPTPDAKPDATVSATPEGSGGAEATAPAESPYNYAVGKYEADENGLALEKYEYELPITTTDEVISMWTLTWVPQYLPENGYGDSELPMEVENRTGVNIEYVLVTAETRAENFAVLLASDALCDIMCCAEMFYGGAFRSAVEDDGYFINVYDYREYMPNYIYEATRDPEDIDTIRTVFTEDDLILNVYSLKQQGELSDLPFIRGDLLAKLGKTNDDLVTFDDLHEVFTAFKSQFDIEHPFTLYSTLEVTGCYNLTAFDTYCYVNPESVPNAMVDNGKVRLATMNEQDRNLMTMLNQWYSEGLIDPNWSSYVGGVADINDKIKRGEVPFLIGGGPVIHAHDDVIPADAEIGWVPMHRPRLSEDQTLHLGFDTPRVYYGSAAIAATCENIPLACSWLDYRYSDSGSHLYGYGIEGLCWEYTEDGNDIRMTDFICDHPAFWGMIMTMYGLNHLVEPGLAIEYAYKMEENRTTPQYLAYAMETPHDNALVYPTAITYDAEQTEIIARRAQDVSTYISENYLAFLDGSKPLSDWDKYVEGLYAIGVQKIIDVYQEAYDAFMA